MRGAVDIAIGTEVVIDRHHSRITVTSREVAAVAIILASFFLNYFLALFLIKSIKKIQIL